MKIYHNPRCSKSREALKILQEKGFQPEVVEYLKSPLSQEELKALLNKLGMAAEQIIRKGEAVFKENYKGKSLAEEAWIAAMAEHPKLMERPIFENASKAVVGRPPEKVLEIL